MTCLAGCAELAIRYAYGWEKVERRVRQHRRTPSEARPRPRPTLGLTSAVGTRLDRPHGLSAEGGYLLVQVKLEKQRIKW